MSQAPQDTAAVRPTALVRQEFDHEAVALIKQQIAKGATDGELKLFLRQCTRTGLDPFARHIFFIKRRQFDPKSKQFIEVGTTQVSIDGLRLIAERTGQYRGQVGPFWWDAEKNDWVDVWLKPGPPAAAKVGVWRAGFVEPIYGTAKFDSYCQRNKDGEPVSVWKSIPEAMIAKCAEALALRRSFPQETSGLYTTDEMGQAIVVASVDKTTGQVYSQEDKDAAHRYMVDNGIKGNIARDLVSACEARKRDYVGVVLEGKEKGFTKPEQLITMMDEDLEEEKAAAEKVTPSAAEASEAPTAEPAEEASPEAQEPPPAAPAGKDTGDDADRFRKAYFAIAAELGWPKHDVPVNKLVNYEGWSELLNTKVVSASTFTEDQWRSLWECAGQVKIGSMEEPEAFSLFRDGKHPAQKTESKPKRGGTKDGSEDAGS